MSGNLGPYKVIEMITFCFLKVVGELESIFLVKLEIISKVLHYRESKY